MKENKYYVYLHIKEDTGEPFYIGKGKDKRALSFRNRNRHWTYIFIKHGFDVIFLEIDLSEKEAFEKEIYWIDRIGRRDLGKGPLVNYSDGGEGQTGKIVSDKTKQKLSQLNTGIKHPNYGKIGKWKNVTGKEAPASKSIIQYDLNNNIINIYYSIREATSNTGILNTSISNNLRGFSKTTKDNNKKKYIWKYGN